MVVLLLWLLPAHSATRRRALWAAEQSVVQVRLAELANRVALYKALGG